MTGLADFELVANSRRTAQQQVAEYIQEQICAGAIPLGEKLPAHGDLARVLGVSATTVHWAFQRLIDKGLIVTLRGRGSFVAEELPGIRRLGVYYLNDGLTRPDQHFLRALHAGIGAISGQRRIKTTILNDQGGICPPELAALVNSPECPYDGLIVPGATQALVRSLDELDIPKAYFFPEQRPDCVEFDMDQFNDLAIGALHASQCHSVGLITPFPVNMDVSYVPPGQIHASERFTQHFLDLVSDYGFQVRDQWIREPHTERLAMTMPPAEIYGYEQARALLACDQLPDGLIVFSDITARGVITALLEAGERCANIRLVLHKNAEVPLLCPLPAHYIVSSANEMASTLIGVLDHQVRHEPTGGPIRIPLKLQSNR